MSDGQTAIQNSINFEGWRHDHSSDRSRVLIENGEGEVMYERSSEYQT